MLLCSLSAQAQTVETFRIEEVKSGGFLLVTTIQDTARRLPANENLQRFNTPEQLTKYVEYLREQAKEGEAKAAKVVEDAKVEAKKLLANAEAAAKKEREQAPKTALAADKIEAAGEAFFNPKPVTPEPDKTKPKKKKKA